jgi:hypothetical protein
MGMPKGITAEDVWAILRDTALQQKEGDRRFREMSAEADRKMEKTRRIVEDLGKAHRETEKALKEAQRIVGDLGNRVGDIAEQLLTPGLEGKFEQFGLFFEKLNRNVKWKNNDLDFSMEFDVVLENNRQVIIVEVKSKLTTAAVDEQIKRMEKLHRYADTHGDGQRFYCAMAALTAPANVIDYTLTKGFYLIMPSGKDVKIMGPVPSPGVW